jgi:GTP-binding protein
MTLEDCMEFIEHDECIEVTPLSIRLRKVMLNEDDRKKAARRLQDSYA